jgi:hypothetical protein
MLMNLKPALHVVAIVVILMAAVQFTAVEALGEQTWYLTPTSYTGTPADDGTDHHANKIMSKTQTSDDHVAFTSTETMWWYADNAAECDLTFGAGSWSLHLYHDTMDDESGEVGETITADIYKVKADGTATRIATGSNTTVSGQTETIFTCSPLGNQDFITGDRLAVRISWSSTDTLWIYYSSAKPSTLKSPSSDPGYPIPEPSTLVLFATGLFTLAGYVLVSRRLK